jgi:hypothetical protein
MDSQPQVANQKHTRNQAQLLFRVVLITVLVLGAFASYRLALVEGVRPGPRQRDISRISSELYDGYTLGQIFQVHPEKLKGVRLWLNVPNRPTEGTITLRMFSFDFNADIAETTLDVAAISQSGPTDFRFPSVDAPGWPQETDLTVELRLIAQGIDQAHAIQARGSTNRYSNGLIVLNGEQWAPEDLAFEVLYTGSYLDQAVPITQLAMERPGLLGWPPLYAILTWLLLWSACVLLISLFRALRATAVSP